MARAVVEARERVYSKSSYGGMVSASFSVVRGKYPKILGYFCDGDMPSIQMTWETRVKEGGVVEIVESTLISGERNPNYPYVVLEKTTSDRAVQTLIEQVTKKYEGSTFPISTRVLKQRLRKAMLPAS